MRTQTGPKSRPQVGRRFEHSSQFRGGKFRNPVKALTMGPKEWLSSAVRYFTQDSDQEPSGPLPTIPVDLSFFRQTGAGHLNTTWLGHSSLMINIGGYRILTDPVFETKVSFVGPTRYNGDVPLDPKRLSSIDAVVISHDHYDHLNKASICMLTPETQRFITPLGVGKRLRRWGVPPGKIFELDWWDTVRLDQNLEITATPAQHFSGRGLFDRDRTLWASWVISACGFNLFFSGDSGYFDGFRSIGERFGPFDITFMECGAYDQLWHRVHMVPEETVKAHTALNGRLLHPIHWGTFNLAHHAWYDPMQRIAKAAHEKSIPLALPVAGQSIIHGSEDYGSRWWDRHVTPEETVCAK